MAFSESPSRQSLIPSFIYNSPMKSKSTAISELNMMSGFKNPSGSVGIEQNFVIPAPAESRRIEMYSPAYYAAGTVGGILSCGPTHAAVTPLDVVKCNMQVFYQDFVIVYLLVFFFDNLSFGLFFIYFYIISTHVYLFFQII